MIPPVAAFSTLLPVHPNHHTNNLVDFAGEEFGESIIPFQHLLAGLNLSTMTLHDVVGGPRGWSGGFQACLVVFGMSFRLVIYISVT